MQDLNKEIIEFINLKVSNYVSQKTKLDDVLLDEDLMFDNDNNQKLMKEHYLTTCGNIPLKYNVEQGTNWKNVALLSQLQDYFLKYYAIKFYVGYHASINAFNQCYINQQTRCIIVYTNTNLYLVLRFNVSQSGTYRNASIYAYSNNTKDDTLVLNLDNNQSNNYPADNWFIQHHNIRIPLSQGIHTETNAIILTNLVRNIHPHVYADYLYLCNPTKTFNILNNSSSKTKIYNLTNEVNKLTKDLDHLQEEYLVDERSRKSEKDMLLKQKISLENIANQKDIELNQKTTELEGCKLINECLQNELDQLKLKYAELEQKYLKIEQQNQLMVQLLSCN